MRVSKEIINKMLRDLHNSVDSLDKKFIKAEIRLIEKKLDELRKVDQKLSKEIKKFI